MIFLDNNATTPILTEVVEAMLYDLDGIPRNPSSVTFYGRQAKEKIIESRRTIAKYFGLSPDEIFFTSGGTESNHMLIQGFYKKKKGPILTTKTEHASALEAMKPYNPIYLNVDSTGTPKLADIELAILEHSPSFIFLSGANTETGILLNLEEVAKLAENYQIPLVIDGVGLLGKTLLNDIPKGVSAISFSGHKCHGPKGIGLAIIRKPHKIDSLFKGGYQERGMRAGTENVSGILGLAKAISLIDETAFEKMEQLRDYFENELLKRFPEFEINGRGKRLPNTSNIYFKDQDAEMLLMNLDQMGVIASLGSACSSGTLSPSHVLMNMGYSNQRALSSLRFSLNRFTTKDEIDKAIEIISSSIALRSLK
jgi:cysteine desulfurase